MWNHERLNCVVERMTFDFVSLMRSRHCAARIESSGKLRSYVLDGDGNDVAHAFLGYRGAPPGPVDQWEKVCPILDNENSVGSKSCGCFLETSFEAIAIGLAFDGENDFG